jgi:hypothetical protein
MGDMISPVIFMQSFMQPSHRSDLGGSVEGGGVTSAIGSPLRVTMNDLPVILTFSNKCKHVALNFEMGIVSCMPGSQYIWIITSSIPWSMTIVQMSYFTMKIALFLDIIERDEIFFEHGFQVSGVRLALAFSLLTPDT